MLFSFKLLFFGEGLIFEVLSSLKLSLSFVSFSSYLAFIVVSGLIESHTSRVLSLSHIHLESFSGHNFSSLSAFPPIKSTFFKYNLFEGLMSH